MTKALVLIGISGGRVGASHTVVARKSYVIGSSSGCDLTLHDRNVAARHAELRQILDRWFVVPLDTSAQIFVDGQLVRSQARLPEGATLTLGTATFKISQSEVNEQEVGQAMSANATVPKLGEYLIRQGIVTRAQVQHAIQHQTDLQRMGRRIQLGDVLYELGYASRNQLERVAQEQRSDFYEHFRD